MDYYVHCKVSPFPYHSILCTTSYIRAGMPSLSDLQSPVYNIFTYTVQIYSLLEMAENKADRQRKAPYNKEKFKL